MVPFGEMRKLAGIPWTWNASAIFPAGSYPIRKGGEKWAMNCVASARSLAAYCSWIVFSQGKDSLQGPHQEAKKSTYTTLPARSAGLIRPSSVGRSIAGATAGAVVRGAE